MKQKHKITLGQKFHHLTILADLGLTCSRRFVLVQCDCEAKTIFSVRFDSLLGKTTSCGCIRSAKRTVSEYIDKKINHLTILADLGYRGRRRRYVRVQCDCVDKVIKDVDFDKLFRDKNATISCGCAIREYLRKTKTTHGKTNTKEFKCWQKIKERCNNPNVKEYIYYGARGITMCNAWQESFEQFLLDMGNAPTAKHTIERIDNNKNYDASNCKWATMTEQANNKSNNRLLTYNGVTKNITQWSNTISVSVSTLRRRIDNLGWGVVKALSTPTRGR